MHLSRRQFWLLLAVETAFLAVLALWVLWQFEQLFEPFGLLVALAIIVAGDVATGLLLQRYAPTRITLESGETSRLAAKVVGGFGESELGEVLVKGERWRARLEGKADLAPGDHVDIVARAGLTLYVRPGDGTCNGNG